MVGRTAVKKYYILNAIQTALHYCLRFLQHPYLKGVRGNSPNVRVGSLILCF